MWLYPLLNVFTYLDSWVMPKTQSVTLIKGEPNPLTPPLKDAVGLFS